MKKNIYKKIIKLMIELEQFSIILLACFHKKNWCRIKSKILYVLKYEFKLI